MLAVIDTNIWISATLSPDGHCGPIVDFVENHRVTPVVCDLTQSELSRVLTRPSLVHRYQIQPAEVARTILLVRSRAQWLPDPEVRPICRDPRDDVFVALAAASRAEYLVTRDDDLKGDPSVMAHLAELGCEVVSVRTFIERLAR